MAEFLFEIFCEEIPARMQQRAGLDLTKALLNGLSRAGLKVTGEHCYTGPRRLVFTADIPLRTPDISEERKGPRVGSPEQALAGFMKAAGLSDISQAQTRTDPKKGEFYVAVIEKKGVESADLIAELIPPIMNDFPWPKSMKSGSTNFRWVRPLQSMICLLDGKIVDFEVGGIKTGNTTEGHRRHGKGPYTVSDFADYRAQLEGPSLPHGHVMICTCERKAKILEEARKACAQKGLELVEDEGLLNEVAGLTEWPIVLLGDMDASFLELPDEVIRLTLKSHQKTFTVRDPKTGALAAHFMIVANQIAPDGGAEIKKGNGKVISARLSDAKFFRDEDAKKKLVDYYEKLDSVVFHKSIGSMQGKAEKISRYAYDLAENTGANPEIAKQAGKLAKCDLVTQTVIEFTSLQGQIGGLMYRNEGGDADIAAAIEQHYKPAGPSDTVPTEPAAVAVAMADKLSTLAEFWAIDEKPTGSKDPFALRRAALGVVRIVLDNNIRRLDLTNRLSVYIRETKPSIGTGLQEARDLLAFILDRLKVYLRDKGMRHDIIDAVLTGGEDDLVSIVNRVEALQSFLETDEGANLLAGYKRAANILKSEAKKAELPDGAPSRPTDAHGASLFDALEAASQDIDTALAREDYSASMLGLAQLREPIDAFFTHVQVISDDTAVKENNLKLLLNIRDTSRKIADFEAIQG